MKTLPEEGIASYDINLNQTKKTLKVFTFPKSTKNVLWQEGNPFLYLIYV